MTYYTERNGQAQPLVMLHGFTGCTRNWSALLPLLTPHYDVLRVDLPGHGQTPFFADLSAYTLPIIAQNLADLIQASYTEPVFLLGYSMGGRLALYFAVHYPHLVKHLILESSSAGLKTEAERLERQQQDNTLADQIEQKGLAWFVDYWEKLPLFASQQSLSPAERDQLRALRLQNSPQGLAQSLRGMGTGVQPSLWEFLPMLKTPVTLLAGELDTKFCQINQAMHALLPNSTLAVIPQAGHTIHLEQPLVYVQHILPNEKAHQSGHVC